jgi:hypothetical protein
MMKGVVSSLLMGILLLSIPAFAENGDLIVDGKLGVGITPSGQLHLASDTDHDLKITRGSGQYGFRIFRSASAGSFQMQVGSAPNTWETKIQFGEGEGPNTKLILNPTGGNVGIGTTSPSAKLEIVPSAYYAINHWGNGLRISNASAIYWAKGATYSYSLGQSGDILYFGRATSEAVEGTQEYDMVLSGGHVGIGTVVPDTSHKLTVDGSALMRNGIWEGSDSKLKKNIQPVDDALTKVLKLGGVSFEWQEDEYKTKGMPDGPEILKKKEVPSGREYGVIAQEIEKVLPELVKEDAQGTKAVKYSGIIPVLIEAIKEQQKMIDSLKTEFAQLKNGNLNKQ